MLKQDNSKIMKQMRQYINLSNTSKNERNSKEYVTGLPTLMSIFSSLEKILSKQSIGLIYLDIKKFREIEAIYGKDIGEHVLKNIAQALNNLSINFFGFRENFGVCSLGGDDFIIFINPPLEYSDYEVEFSRLKNNLEDIINKNNQGLRLKNKVEIHLSYTEIKLKENYSLESLIYKALKEASYNAKNYLSSIEHAQWQNIRQVINNKEITSVYQPIISLRNGEVLGYEALSRGPKGSMYESPLKLFSSAKKHNYTYELECICHESAITNAQAIINTNTYLFINIDPFLLNYNNYQKGFMQNLLTNLKIKYQNIVLELTERSNIDDFASFNKILRDYRNQGFLIAVDDAGAGYSSLQAIAELQPEFVKIDMSLVQDVHKSHIKRAMIEAFTNFSSKINARIICEGIESEEEFSTLIKMGCDFGQGYYISKPKSSEEILVSNKNYYSLINFKDNQEYCTISKKIGDVVIYQEYLSPETKVAKIIDLFNENKALSGLVICQEEKPIGLVMREKLFSVLGSRYGYDLFIKRSVKEIMDNKPLILFHSTPLEEAAPLVAERLDKGIMDYLIVTKEDKYQGIVTVAKMLDTFAKIQIEQAKDCNPLTGFPGNRCITWHIAELIKSEEQMMVLYFDLDNFKAFNDYYGFEHGDRALHLLAKIIEENVLRLGNKEDLIAHIGGDDFVVITTMDKANLIAEEVIKGFDKQIINLYDKSSIENAYIISKNRKGDITTFPIMSLSIAGIDNQSQKFTNPLELGEMAAEIKKLAKKEAGSCYIINKRGR